MMCCGHPPFSGNSITVLHSILRDSHVPVRQVMPNLPESLSDMVDLLLSKTREGRIQSAAQVESILTEIARGGTPSDEQLPVIPARNINNSLTNTTSPPTAAPNQVRDVAAVGRVVVLSLAILLLWGIWKSQGTSSSPEVTQNGVAPDSPPPQSDPEKQRSEPIASRAPQRMTVGGSDANFPSLRAALLQVQPEDVLEIVGALPSDDSLLLNDPSRHSRVTIEWKNKVPFEFGGSTSAAITIDSVPGLTIRGANVLTKNSHVVSVRGDCSG